MKDIIIFAIILIVIFILIAYKIKEHYMPNNMQINVLDINTDDRVLIVLRNMLKLVDNLFQKSNITYWMDSGTLLGAVRHGDIIPWDDDADLVVLKEDEQKLINLKPILNKSGYDLVKFWGGYKIFPVNGRDIKYFNRNWFWNDESKDIEESENFNYKFPFIDICIIENKGDIHQYTDPKVRRVWQNYYHNNEDIFPLKRYRFNNFTLIGPNNPKPYLNRAYGNDWSYKAYKQYDHENQMMLSKTKFNL